MTRIDPRFGEVRPASQCGTNGGYQRHKNRNETPCASCKAAAAAYRRALRLRNGETERTYGAHEIDPERPPPPPPASYRRCDCGRLVWDFETGLCGVCEKEPPTRKGATPSLHPERAE